MPEYEGEIFAALVGGEDVDSRAVTSAYGELVETFRDLNPFSEGWFTVYDICRSYYLERGSAPTLEVLTMEAERLDDEKLRTTVDLRIKEIQEQPRPDRAKLCYLLDRLRDYRRRQRLQEILKTSVAIVNDGVKVDRQQTLKGHDDAISWTAEELLRLQVDLGDTIPRGDLRDELEAAQREYAEAEKGRDKGILTGLSRVDAATGGGAPGEVWIYAGYTSEGKSTLLLNTVWNAWVNGHNVAVATIETKRSRWRNMLVSRHSTHPKFHSQGIPPIPYSKIRTGTLTEEEEEVLWEIVWEDLMSCPDYGERFEIFEPPERFTVQDLHGQLLQMDSVYRIDAFFLDYLMLGSPRRDLRGSHKEDAEMFKDLKLLAENFRGGRGLWIVTPHQINRKGRDYAEKHEMYTLRDLSMTAEAERTADKIVYVLRLEKHKALKQVQAGLIKNRGGLEGIDPKFMLMEQFEFSRLSDEDMTIEEIGYDDEALGTISL